jgi:hypothetical protein
MKGIAAMVNGAAQSAEIHSGVHSIAKKEIGARVNGVAGIVVSRATHNPIKKIGIASGLKH